MDTPTERDIGFFEDGEDIVIRVPRQLVSKAEWAKVSDLPRVHEVGAHRCPIDACHISVEEHHRIAWGYMQELAFLRRRVRELENTKGAAKRIA